MEQYTPIEAKEQFDDLMARAARGEDVRIKSPQGVTLKLVPVEKAPDVTAKRVTDTMPPFVPLDKPRVPGRWEGKLGDVPPGFFDPLTEEELKDWYGDDV